MKTNKKLATVFLVIFISFEACKNKGNDHFSEMELSVTSTDNSTSDSLGCVETIPTNPRTNN